MKIRSSFVSNSSSSSFIVSGNDVGFTMTSLLAKYPIKNKEWKVYSEQFDLGATFMAKYEVGAVWPPLDPWRREFPTEPSKGFKFVDDSFKQVECWRFVTTVEKNEVTCYLFAAQN